MARSIYLVAICLLLLGCDPKQEASQVSVTANSASINPESWPEQAPTMVRDREIDNRINDLLSRMTLEEKVG